MWSAGKPISLCLALICIVVSLGQLYLLAKPLKLSLFYLVIGVLAGLIMDTLFSYVGVHDPSRIMIAWPLVPLWLIGLWVAFVTYTRTGLDGMRGNYVLQAVAGSFCGPLAWLGGGKMGAGTVNENVFMGYGVMAIGWALICLILFRISDKLQAKVKDE